MNKIQIRKKILSEIFYDYFYQEEKHEFITFCPKGCHSKKRKLQINIEKNQGHCWVCDDRGSALYFIKKYGTRQQAKRYAKTLGVVLSKDNEKSLNISYPEGYKFLLDAKNEPLGKIAYSYVKDELNLPDNIILQNRLGICSLGKYANRLIFLSYNEKGDLNYYLGRSLLDTYYKKYLNCNIEKKRIVFNELYINWSKPIILVEGVKASLKHWKISNIIPMNGSPILNSTYKLFYDIIINGVKEVFVAFDKEAYLKSIETMNKIQSCGISVKFVNLLKQPDEISTDDFKHALTTAKPFSNFDYLIEKVRLI